MLFTDVIRTKRDGGELTAANRGLLEYSDLLKRPLEAYKYLITTVEQASISLSNATISPQASRYSPR